MWIRGKVYYVLAVNRPVKEPVIAVWLILIIVTSNYLWDYSATCIYNYREKQESFSTQVFFFFQLDSHFFLSTLILKFRLVFFFFHSWTYVLQISTHTFHCIPCILQVSTYVLCFQHVFTIGIILSSTERHIITWRQTDLKRTTYL